MLRKPLASLAWQDVLDLATNGISESTHLEFKREPITDNLEVAQDVSSIANGGGGDLILGVPETNGVAQLPTPFPNGEKEGNRVVQIVLSGVAPRLRIATQAIAGPGGDVVVVRIQRSHMPAMVHLKNRSEFWIRRDRQRVRMSHAEIIAMATAGQEETFTRERFLERRIERNKSSAGVVTGVSVGLLLAATPNNLVDDTISIRNEDVQRVMRESSTTPDTIIEGVAPIPSLDGLEGRLRSNPNYRFEIHRNGHMEVYLGHAAGIAAVTKKPFFDAAPGGRRIEDIFTVLDAGVLVRSVVEFVRRVRKLHEIGEMFEPFTVTLVLYNASRSALPRGAEHTEEGSIIVDPGKIFVDNDLIVSVPGFPDEASLRPSKLLCDRLWQAYGKFECGALDNDGHLI